MSVQSAIRVATIVDHPVHTPERPAYPVLGLPTGPDQFDWLGKQVGGLPEDARYHRLVTVHVHGNGQNIGLEPNAVLWTLASAWLTRPLDYLLWGPAVLTGPESADGSGFAGLLPQLERQTLKALEVATDWWIKHDEHLPIWASHPTSAAYREVVELTRSAL